MEESLNLAFSILIAAVETCGAIVIGVGVVRAMMGYIKCFILDYEAAEVASLRARPKAPTRSQSRRR